MASRGRTLSRDPVSERNSSVGYKGFTTKRERRSPTPHPDKMKSTRLSYSMPSADDLHRSSMKLRRAPSPYPAPRSRSSLTSLFSSSSREGLFQKPITRRRVRSPCPRNLNPGTTDQALRQPFQSNQKPTIAASLSMQVNKIRSSFSHRKSSDHLSNDDTKRSNPRLFLDILGDQFLRWRRKQDLVACLKAHVYIQPEVEREQFLQALRTSIENIEFSKCKINCQCRGPCCSLGHSTQAAKAEPHPSEALIAYSQISSPNELTGLATWRESTMKFEVRQLTNDIRLFLSSYGKEKTTKLSLYHHRLLERKLKRDVVKDWILEDLLVMDLESERHWLYGSGKVHPYY